MLLKRMRRPLFIGGQREAIPAWLLVFAFAGYTWPLMRPTLIKERPMAKETEVVIAAVTAAAVGIATAYGAYTLKKTQLEQAHALELQETFNMGRVRGWNEHEVAVRQQQFDYNSLNQDQYPNER